MKLWLLDADVIIDLLSLDVFDKLARSHEVNVASTVIEEIKSYTKSGTKHRIDFRVQYVENGLVKECSASPDEIKTILDKIPAHIVTRQLILANWSPSLFLQEKKI